MEHVLSLSYGKDSLACLAAIEQLGWPLDRIIHSEIWATDTIPADLPPMVKFKKKADAIIKERWGIEVEHTRSKWTYESYFYKMKTEKAKFHGIHGFPHRNGAWCVGRLKTQSLDKLWKGGISYLGIAVDEPERVARHSIKPDVRLPLVDAGWTEPMCRDWCEKNDLLSPIYTSSARGGCWFCHNQGLGQLRLLRKTYPELWELLLKWDDDSPFSFKADGHTVRDYDRRFQLEDDGRIPTDFTFRWEMIHNPPKFVGTSWEQISFLEDYP